MPFKRRIIQLENVWGGFEEQMDHHKLQPCGIYVFTCKKCLFEFLFDLANRYAVHYWADPSRHLSSDKSNPMFAVIFVYFSKTTRVNSTQAWESECPETILLGTCSGV